MAGIINNSANPINSAKLKKPDQPDQPEDEAVVKDIVGLQDPSAHVSHGRPYSSGVWARVVRKNDFKM